MTDFTQLDFIPSVTSLILLVCSLMLYFVYYLRIKYTYWERQGVPYVKPVHFFFGSTKDLILQTIPRAFVFERYYKQLDSHKFGGFYQMTKPSVIIRDPELIRTVTVKNFSNFHDRFPDFVNEKMDPLASNLINLCGQRWRSIRYKLSPTFSSGKLRRMENLIRDCVCELDEYLSRAISGDTKTGDVLNVNELMAKFTTDIIGTCAFGFQCNSIRDEESEFRRFGRTIFTPNYRFHIRTFLQTLHPRLITLFKLKALNEEVKNFFKSAIAQAVKHRESSTYRRNDLLQLMINIQAEEKAQLRSKGHQHIGHQKTSHNQNGQQNETHVEKSKQDENSNENISGYCVTTLLDLEA